MVITVITNLTGRTCMKTAKYTANVRIQFVCQVKFYSQENVYFEDGFMALQYTPLSQQADFKTTYYSNIMY